MSKKIQKNPLDLSAPEIYAYLNSGQYISPSVKKQLQQKLDFERKSNRFSALDEFYTMIASSSSNKKEPKKKTVDYPELCKNSSQLSVSVQKNVIDFTSITNQNTTIAVTKNLDTIFVENELLLSFIDIQKLLDSYAVQRVIMRYFSIRRKIKNLKLLSKINPPKAQFFKSMFMFDSLVEQENMLIDYIKIFQGLEQLKNLYDSKDFLSLVNNYNIANGKIMPSCKTKKLFEKFLYIAYMCSKTCPIFESKIKEYFQFAFDIIDQVFIVDNETQVIDKYYEILEQILVTMNDMAISIDDEIECDYCVYVKGFKKDMSFIPMFVKDGISAWTYISCDEEITTELEFDDELMDHHELANITFDELQIFFNKRIKHEDSHRIQLRFTDKKPHIININFYIQDQEIPKPKIYIKIKDLPKNALVMTSIIRNHDLDEELDVPIITPKNNHMKHWLNRRSKSSRMNSHKLSEQEYKMLNAVWQNNYSIKDTQKNEFAVNYLFNQLLTEDKYNKYIKPQMLASFKKMAFDTSK